MVYSTRDENHMTLKLDFETDCFCDVDFLCLFIDSFRWFVGQVFNDAIEALRISYRKMNPFCVPFATTNMGSAMLALDLVSLNIFILQC